MNKILTLPPRLYQRCRPFCDRLPPALGMAGMFLLTAQATGVFTYEWRAFIAVGVLSAGLVAPVAGYLLFVLALALPLYSISIYVAALALAFLLPPLFFPQRYIAAVLLVLAAPLLSQCRLALLIPFLGGLWWAEWGGALMGLGAALWLKIFAGMCGAAPDLLLLGGQPLPVDLLLSRFQTANSLQTLLWIAGPFTSDAQGLLLSLLQILAWGLAGYGIGLMHDRMKGARRPALVLLAGLSAGLLGLAAGSLAAPLALGLLRPVDIPVPFLIECGWAGLAVIGIYVLFSYLTRPALASPPGRVELYRPPARPTVRPEPLPVARPQPQDEEQTDIIMIDLD